MSTYLYDEALVEKLRNWTKNTQVKVFSPDDTKRLIETIADESNDSPVELPIICLRRKTGLNIINPNKRPLTYDGLTLEANPDTSLQLNAIPIDVQYQLDIYTRYFKEADEFLRNIIFNIINYPKLTIKVPCDSLDIEHDGYIRMTNNVDDNSSIPERLIPGQFTRLTCNVYIDDAYLWNAKVRTNYRIVDAEVAVED